MNRVMGVAAGVLLATAAWAQQLYTDKQLEARFYYDLGADSLDVSSYPQEQQDNYKVFANTCSQCHSLARALNAPLTARADWRRYVVRMHLKNKARDGSGFTQKDAKAIIAFLTYDASERKIKNKAAFDAHSERLKKEFEQVKAERSRRQVESDKLKVKSRAQ